jgi:hypothetical protein
MPDYSKTIVYKIVCKNVEISEIYVGSTTEYGERKIYHIWTCNNPNSERYNLKVYQFIREHGGFENWDFIVVEKYPCENDVEKRQREMYWCDTLHSTLNTNRPIATEEQRLEKMREYNKNHIDKITEYQLKYHEENKERISQQKKEYREKHKERDAEKKKGYYEKNKQQFAERSKEYREKHKELISKQKKEYREKNRERFAEKQPCPECGQLMCRGSIPRHIKRVHRI